MLSLSPQPGPQTSFLASTADIAIYGGSAGGGKTFGLLLEPLRHLHNPLFNVICFRRTSKQVMNPGGLWDESLKIYLPTGARPVFGRMEWNFPAGWQLNFSHLEHEKNVYDYQGAQIVLIMFDELTHFTEKMFTYMLSRNRSTSGIPGYVRATCNPDKNSWVREFIDWWIGDDGYPIPERSGQLRWFIRQDDRFIWANSRQELVAQYGRDEQPKSVTFISASIYDNKILMEKDPSYLSNLKALSRVDRLRLLGGNWDVTESAGSLFRQEWFPIVDAIPPGWITIMRFWDRASTKPNENNKDPDWTRGLKLYRYPDGTFIIADIKSMRDTPHQVERLIRQTAEADGYQVKIMSQQDPGSAGVTEAMHFARLLQGFNVRTVVISKDKINRAKPVSAQAEAGNIRVLRAKWNKEFFEELEDFPDGKHDDQVDVLSGAYNSMVGKASILDTI